MVLCTIIFTVNTGEIVGAHEIKSAADKELSALPSSHLGDTNNGESESSTSENKLVAVSFSPPDLNAMKDPLVEQSAKADSKNINNVKLVVVNVEPSTDLVRS